MFIVTISFKNCNHQVVLRYKTDEALRSAIAAQSGGTDGPVSARDDFGTFAIYTGEDVASILTINLAESLKGRNAEDKIRARAAQDLKQDMLNDPSLEFIPDRNPFFGRR